MRLSNNGSRSAHLLNQQKMSPALPSPLADPPCFSFFFLPSSLQLKVSRWLESEEGCMPSSKASETGKKKRRRKKKEREVEGGRDGRGLSWRAVCDFREHFLRGEKVGLRPPETQLLYFLPLLLHPNLPSLKLLGGFSNFWQFDALCDSIRTSFIGVLGCNLHLCVNNLNMCCLSLDPSYILTHVFNEVFTQQCKNFLLCAVQGSLVCESCVSGTMWCNLHVFCMWSVHCKGCVCLSECVFVCIFKAAHVIVLVCVLSLNVA